MGLKPGNLMKSKDGNAFSSNARGAPSAAMITLWFSSVNILIIGTQRVA
jgi:hypothetical protein